MNVVGVLRQNPNDVNLLKFARNKPRKSAHFGVDPMHLNRVFADADEEMIRGSKRLIS